MKAGDFTQRKVAVKSDWETMDMPLNKDNFVLKRHFCDAELQKLKFGHIPREMEDKWFFYFDNNTLYAHRSWTGVCIYIVEFDFETDEHRVTVNMDKEQYQGKSKNDELNQLNTLLNRWVQLEYDYYEELLNETAEMLQSGSKNI